MEGDGAEDADGAWSGRSNQMTFFQINCKICSVEAIRKDKRGDEIRWGNHLVAGMPRSGLLVREEAAATLLWEEQHFTNGVGAEEVAAVLGCGDTAACLEEVMLVASSRSLVALAIRSMPCSTATAPG
jgi:hypothetical protein